MIVTPPPPPPPPPQSFLDEPGSSHKYQQQRHHHPLTALSSTQLEARVREELISLGLLDAAEVDRNLATYCDHLSSSSSSHHPSQKDSKSEEDEILVELKRAQAELRTVVCCLYVCQYVCCISACLQAEYNQQQRHRLASLARAEMQRQEVREQLKEVDGQVMDWLSRFTVSPSTSASYDSLSVCLSLCRATDSESVESPSVARKEMQLCELSRQELLSWISYNLCVCVVVHCIRHVQYLIAVH